MYNPKPIDTTGIVLPPELLVLTERIAENVHDVWAAGRIAEGWTWGETRSSEKKTNPTLVPYDQLPDSEKEYDRNTALETLKLIIRLGYRIIPAEDDQSLRFLPLRPASVSPPISRSPRTCLRSPYDGPPRPWSGKSVR